ncbi:hypothetical protein BDY19DRAFT_911287 [Irpex rosettiformis]|uniref:Uncharacterized protein n=1 Tax=Irpex rosettiformis TaxID=378272 RepID=A0ACB8UIE9_9APHY|nr:hypothetical protein BDY19DRAFT_911287 [Irpex rosettiformis]
MLFSVSADLFVDVAVCSAAQALTSTIRTSSSFCVGKTLPCLLRHTMVQKHYETSPPSHEAISITAVRPNLPPATFIPS